MHYAADFGFQIQLKLGNLDLCAMPAMVSAAVCQWRLGLWSAYKADDVMRKWDYKRMLDKNSAASFEGMSTDDKFVARVANFAGVDLVLALRPTCKGLLESCEDLVDRNLWKDDYQEDSS